MGKRTVFSTFLVSTGQIDDHRQFLLARGALVNDVDHRGQTALGKARAAGHTEVVNLLKRAGGWD
jgi:hypothetical protein